MEKDKLDEVNSDLKSMLWDMMEKMGQINDPAFVEVLPNVGMKCKGATVRFGNRCSLLRIFK